MIRTRNFLLYVVIVVFLLTGLSTTYVRQTNGVSGASVSKDVRFTGSAPGVVDESEPADTRQSTIERLRAKIAAGTGLSLSREPVFTSVDTPTATIATDTATATPVGGTGGVVRCPASNLSLLAAWPSEVVTSAAEGARTFSSEVEVVQKQGTTTSVSKELKTFLAFPLVPTPSSNTACVSDVVGVTAAGQPLVNQSAGEYKHFSEFGFVGYALDGFPIYGPLDDASALDACGGVTRPAGYQYHLRIDDPNLLNCFRGAPATAAL